MKINKFIHNNVWHLTLNYLNNEKLLIDDILNMSNFPSITTKLGFFNNKGELENQCYWTAADEEGKRKLFLLQVMLTPLCNDKNVVQKVQHNTHVVNEYFI